MNNQLKMFVHAETLADQNNSIPEGDLSLFLRIGSDFTDNYYEYEVPLKMSDLDKLKALSNDIFLYSDEVWLEQNAFNFPLEQCCNSGAKAKSISVKLELLN